MRILSIPPILTLKKRLVMRLLENVAACLMRLEAVYGSIALPSSVQKGDLMKTRIHTRLFKAQNVCIIIKFIEI